MVIKNPSYMCIATDRFKMLDICNYIAAGTSYEKYLKAFGVVCQCEDKIKCVCSNGKGSFCYEYITGFSKLNETELPPQEAFYSNLKKKHLSDEEYERLKFVWSHYKMKILKDLLVWYNNLDVVPFVEAVKRQREFYKSYKLDMLADGVSLPSLAEKIMYQISFREMKPIEFKQGKPFKFSLERFRGYKQQDNDSGRDNDLDMWCVNKRLSQQNYSCSHCGVALTQETASVDRVNNSRGHTNDNFMISCVSCNVARKNMSIHAFRRKKQLEANADRLVFSIDEENKDIYHKMKANIAGGPSIIFTRYAERNITTIRGGKTCRKVIGYDANALYLWALGNHMPCGRLTTIDSYEGLIDDIKNDKIFGFLECDIEIPEHLKSYFSEMTPIFKNTEIDPCERSVIGDHMYEHNLKSKTKRTLKSKKLIGSYFGKQILIYTPLLKWYLDHGMVITKTYSFIKASKARPFKQFTEEVSNARREGDKSEDLKVVGESMKTVGNSAFGRSGMDKTKHKEIKYVDNDESYDKLVMKPTFYDSDELNGAYEMTINKRRIKMNNPIHLSIAIYQLAKLRMLQFYYDFIDFYFDRSDFQYIEMDTDSAYIAFSAENPFEQLIKAELRNHFIENRDKWLPREAHLKYDSKTPGLFEEEWRSDGIYALSPKNYICFNPDESYGVKISAKGVQGGKDYGSNKRNSDILNPESFGKAIKDKVSLQATIKGFRIDKDSQCIITYEQLKTGLSYYYDKRKVLANGIDTEPLDL